jgi:hypothetical protein
VIQFRFCCQYQCSDGSGTQHDYDVFDGIRPVGRIYLFESRSNRAVWFWGILFDVAKRKCYGYAPSLEDAKAAIKEAYRDGPGPPERSATP